MSSPQSVEILGAVAGFCTTFAFVPQLIKIQKQGGRDLSYGMLIFYLAGVLKIAWWLWAAWFLVGFVRAVVIFERRPLDGKLVQDIISALIYLTAAFAIIDYVFDLPIQGLLATSGAIAIILGLALQSTLNDVFSGLVLSLGHPYRPGDQVKFEGGTEGKIVEMN